MKKIIITICAIVGMLFTGCTPDENALISAANAAGSIGLLTWFSIDDPDPQVKATLKEVVEYVDGAAVKIADGETYIDTLLPYVQKFIGEQEKLTDIQKQLINAGAIVVLNGIDTFIAANPKVQSDAKLANKVVAAFCKGCLVVLNMAEDCPECIKAKEIYNKRSMKFREGKFMPN